MRLDTVPSFTLHLARAARAALRHEYRVFLLERRLENARIDRPFSVVNPERLSIGANVMIHRNCHFHCGGRAWSGGRGSISVGRNCNFQENVVLYGAGEIEIGDYVGLGPGVMVFSSREDFSMATAYDEWLGHKLDRVVIGPRVRINAGAVIGPGVTIGEGAVIGAGAVVLRDVPPWMLAAGAPARPLKSRGELDDSVQAATTGTA
jgi:acetyltransferase-like isoleucine patch superfamily enzyme